MRYFKFYINIMSFILLPPFSLGISMKTWVIGAITVFSDLRVEQL